MAFDLKKLLARGPEKIEPKKVVLRETPFEELGLTVLYVLVAGLWCVFSDDILDWLMGSPADSPALQAMKGFNFVTTTGLVLYVVLRRTFRRRRLAEEALRLSQQRFELVARATTGVIWDLNLDTKVIWWSDGIQKLFGYRREDVSSDFAWWADRLHPDDRDRVLAVLRRVGETGGRTWAGEYRFRRQDGSYAIVMDRGFVIHDDANKPVRVVGGVSDITEQRHAEEALQRSRQQLRALTARLQLGREEERAAVAREIHDELGQVLTALKINLDWLERRIEERKNDATLNPLLDRVVESSAMTESAIQSVQRIATDLRPALLDNLGLAAALQEEARRFEQRSGIACELELPDDLPDFPREITTAVFRVFQEALTNVARHAEATRVRVSMSVEARQVLLQLEDNGRGIQPEAISAPSSLGLLGMRERASALGGDVTLAPMATHGTRVTLRLPRTEGEIVLPRL